MGALVALDTRGIDRADWLAARRKGIGSSDAAAVAGLDQYRSPLEVWLDKRGQLPEKPETEAMRFGRIMEPIAAALFSQETGLRVRRRNAVLQSPQYPWALADLDREVLDNDGRAVLECKNSSEYMAERWAGDEVPAGYAIQVHHQLLVTDYTHGYLAVVIGGNRFKWYRIERDAETLRSLVKLESDFWRMVETGQRPTPIGTDSDRELLARLYPSNRIEPGLAAALPDEARDWIAARQQAKRDAEAAETRRLEAENVLKDMLGTADTGLLGAARVTWRARKDGVRVFNIKEG